MPAKRRGSCTGLITLPGSSHQCPAPAEEAGFQGQYHQSQVSRPCSATITGRPCSRLSGSSSRPNRGSVTRTATPWRPLLPLDRGSGDEGEIHGCFKAWAWPVGSCSKGSGTLWKAAVGLYPGPQLTCCPRPEVLGKTAPIHLSPRSVP